MRLPPPPPPPSIIEGGASPRPNLFTVLMIFLHCKRHFGRRLEKKKKLMEPCNSKEKQLWTCKVPPSPSPTAILFLTFLPSSVIKNIHPHLVSTTVDAAAAAGFERWLLVLVGGGSDWSRWPDQRWMPLRKSPLLRKCSCCLLIRSGVSVILQTCCFCITDVFEQQCGH